MRRIPPVTMFLLCANVAVYLLQMLSGDVLVLHFALWPLGGPEHARMGNEIVEIAFHPWQVLTYGFAYGQDGTALRGKSLQLVTSTGGPSAAAPAERDAARRVLYIEDEPLNQVLLQEVFRARPAWRLEIAADGISGLAALEAATPDLVLMDMNLPDTNGLALIARLRSEPRTAALRCIALSADTMREQIEAAHRAGFDAYWTKPIDVTRVLCALDTLLGAGG